MENGYRKSHFKEEIAIINLCRYDLHKEEFVKPVSEIISKFAKNKILRPEEFSQKFKKVVICGTALKDNYYLQNLEKFSWIKNYEGKLLGICAGMHLLGILNQAEVFKSPEIGKTKVKVLRENPLLEKAESEEFEVYSLHNLALRNLKNFLILAKSEKNAQFIKLRKKEHYGVLFHPEVLNKGILERFALL
jgi:GMP synthase-like glutamine amidotransferase